MVVAAAANPAGGPDRHQSLAASLPDVRLPLWAGGRGADRTLARSKSPAGGAESRADGDARRIWRNERRGPKTMIEKISRGFRLNR